MSDLETAVIKTLVYADMFDQALTEDELRRWLVEYRWQDFNIKSKHIEQRDGIYFLSKRDHIYPLKQNQKAIQQQKVRHAQKWLWVFKFVPWVKLVVVTGSVAGGSPRQDDDIDFLIITTAHRLWISRFVVTGVLSILGKRRTPSDDPKRVDNKLCLNMWLSEERLASDHQDIYVANELARMIPILNRHSMYEQYVHANAWVKKVLPNFFESVQRAASSPQKKSSPLTPHPSPLDWLDAKLERWQLRRMRPRTRETVEDGLLMFHPKDYRSEILEKYKKRLKSLLLY